MRAAVPDQGEKGGNTEHLAIGYHEGVSPTNSEYD